MESKHPPAIDLELTLLNCAGAAMYSEVLLPTTDDKVSYSGGVPILAGREREELRASIRQWQVAATSQSTRRHGGIAKDLGSAGRNRTERWW
jgi:hypothetical protein